MYSRHSASNPLSRWIAGLIIILAAVAGFAVFQMRQPTPGQSLATATANPTTVVALPSTTPLHPAGTPIPNAVHYRVVSANAKLEATIIEVYYSRDQDNWDVRNLSIFAGHLQGTAALGYGGNFVLAGHVEMRDGSPGPFAYLKNLAVGDRIFILGDKPGKPVVAQYQVTEVKAVKPDDFDVVRNHGYEELTLITCSDWEQSSQTYNSRTVVHAKPVGAVAVGG